MASPAHRPPPKWKTALLIWLAIYPSLTVLLVLFGDRLLVLPLALRTLVMTGVLVPLMVFVLLPLLQKAFAGWLRK
ncbi:MAG TPA: hypothetical protein PLN54_16320 [Flavobacteriales bacterium]|nr:hypothetical protein [Flavobacteriales bacterium]